jgi:3-oxoacyl-[acyl-carrier-protein] synthase II
MLAMEKAVKAAGLTPGQVEYVNAHATSTPLGDDVEQRAISNVFGDGVAVSSTKGATGHLLGAAGAVEAAFTVLALWHRKAPMTLNLEIPDPPILKNLIRSEPLELPAGHIAAVSNSFGFGGVNASICFATAPER